MMIGQTISHYKILEKIGEGGMGQVFLAEDTELQRKVALKFLPPQSMADPEVKARFKREARATAALNHPNIVTIHEIGEFKDHSYIAMEYVAGKSLRELIDEKAISVDRAIDIISQICQGLQKAHAAGIVHRDLKPANIMIDQDGRVKILDFGLAKLKGADKLTKTAITLGTVYYMSPEQFRAEDVDHRSDIWSVGVMLYEMISGQQPFKGEYEAAVMYAVINSEPQPLTNFRSSIPLTILQIVNRCLEKQPARRYQSVSELPDDLTSVTRDQGRLPSSKSTRLAPAKSSAFRRHRKLWGAAAGMLIVILLGGFFPPANRLVKGWLDFADIPVQKHLLVLPLTNIGGDEGNQALCDGVMETLTSKLTQLEQFQGALWVVPASEVRKGGIESASEAHRAFGVNLVVSGSLQRFENRFRLTLNLVDAKNLRQLNSTVIDNRMSDLAILQDQTVIEMAQMLDVELHPQTRTAFTLGETRVAEAYESYLQGRGYLQHFEKNENLDSAVVLFTRAIEQDSLYALAFAGLGEAYWRKYQAVEDVQWAKKAVLYCERAARLNNQLAPVNVTLGLIHTGTGRYKQAVEAFNRALSIDPVSAEAYLGLASAYEAQGKLEDAESTYKKAIELKPDYWAGYSNLGGFYFQHGRYEEAIKEFRQVIELIPQNEIGYANLGAIYYYLDRRIEAMDMFKRSLEIKPNYVAYSNLATLYFYEERYAEAARMYEKALAYNDRDYKVWGYLGSAYYWTPDEREKAKEAYQRATQLGEEKRKVNPHDAELLINLAAYYVTGGDSARGRLLLQEVIELKPDDLNLFMLIGSVYEDLGEREQALLWIGKALDRGYSIEEIEYTPELKELREDARYQQLLKRIENKTRTDKN